MKSRITLWAAAGFITAAFWALYFYPAAPIPTAPVWTLVRLTCPIVLASDYFHFPVGVYMSMLANAATYAVVGLIAETLRRQLRPAR